MSDKLEMSQQEASWWEHLAGMRAQEKARELGGNPTAIEALATATAGPVVIGGFHLHPASEGTIWTLKRLAREFKAWADGVGMPHAADGEANGPRELLELGLSTLAFADSLGTWDLLAAGELNRLIVLAEKMMFNAPLKVTRALEAHFQQQMQTIRDLTPGAEDTPGKLEAAGNGISRETPIPAEVPA